MPYTFTNVNEAINLEEMNYWKRMIFSNLKIGTEIECCYDDNHEQRDIQRGLTQYLKPTESVSMFGSFGVGEVKGDGSLRNGVELCTVGRRLSFLDLYEQYKYICNKIKTYGPVLNARAGLHNHMLLDYGSYHTCMEKWMPDVIMKNFFQLLRLHCVEMVWITSNIIDPRRPDTITRYNYFCKYNSLLSYTPIDRTVKNYSMKINEDGRYQFCNCAHMKYDGNGNISGMHLELRYPDGSVTPAQIAAQNIMHGAMLIKAVEMSVSGIASIGTNAEFANIKTRMDLIRNDRGNSNDRVSEGVSSQFKRDCAASAVEFIDLLKPQLDQFDGHVYNILNLLAKEPLSQFRIGKTLDEVDEYYNSIINNMYVTDTADCDRILEAINGQSTRAYSELNWRTQTALKMGTTPSAIQNQLFRLGLTTKIKYDQSVGTYVLC